MLDEFWLSALEYVENNSRNGIVLASNSVAPLIPNGMNFEETFQQSLGPDDFDLVIIHKGEVNRIEIISIIEFLFQYRVVYSNEVFIIFGHKNPAVEFNNEHVLSFCSQVKRFFEPSSERPTKSRRILGVF